jgi:MoxR-like ATPase
MIESKHHEQLQLGVSLNRNILAPMKQAFVDKDEIIDLLGVCLVARENLFILGPPGTAKSALVHDLARRIAGRVFDYLLTRFTEPNEIFGPFDIRQLRDGNLVTNTEGMLPEAALVFLDELLNANSAILNSLLLVLNERVFRRGRETWPLPTLCVVGASNRLPEDEALSALFDRFLMRVHCDNVEQEKLKDVLLAGWKLDVESGIAIDSFQVDDIRSLQSLLHAVDFSDVRDDYVATIGRMRKAGIQVSDRRAVKLQRILAASAVLCGRLTANRTDMWVLRYIWDTEEQQELLAAIVGESLSQASDEEKSSGHPRSRDEDAPNPDELASDLDQIAERLADQSCGDAERACLGDRLSILAARSQWVASDQQRSFLDKQVSELWEKLGS